MFDLFTKPQFCTTLKSLDFKNLSFKNTRDFSVLKHGNSADFCKKKKDGTLLNRFDESEHELRGHKKASYQYTSALIDAG